MIYFDCAATTPMDSEVFREMSPYFCEVYGNPDSQHSFGRAAANAVTKARDRIARVMGVKAEELYFTSSGSEAANTALKGVCAANLLKGRHIVVSAAEHASLLESAKDMAAYGYDITYVNPDGNGIVSAEAVKAAIRKDTVFVGVMAANNEVGTVQPIPEIYSVCKDAGVFFFSDCVQIAGVLPFDNFPADGVSFSAHKFYGPKGFGGLYIGKGKPFKRLISGGGQERGLRGGTTFVAGAVGCACALENAYAHAEENNKRVKEIRDYFLERVKAELDGVNLNGCADRRLPSNANLSFDGCDGEQIVFALDLKGIAVSTGSACSSGAVSPSHVILSMGLGERRAKSAVRFTFGKHNTKEEVDIAVRELKACVERIRSK